MALTGLQIYKLLPQSNCGECGSPTCIAFAMKIAGKKASPEDCPRISEEARETLSEEASPPIRPVIIGKGQMQFEAGRETVLFRHDETFRNPTAIAIEVDDTLTEEELAERLKKISALSFERAGSHLAVQAVAVKNSSAEKSPFVITAVKAHTQCSLPLILISSHPDSLEEALKAVNALDSRPLICSADEENYQSMTELAVKYQCPLSVKAPTLEGLSAVTEKIKVLGLRDLVLDPEAPDLREELLRETHIRRLALKKKYKSLGYPTIAWAGNADCWQEIATVNTHISKYAGISVTRLTELWQIFPLLVLRQNIYTDPQKPIQVEPGIYPIGAPDEHSPVLVTTNFSLTYFLVAGEVEASKISSHLLIVDTEGTSVLTAWAADKFNGEIITEAIKKFGLEEKVAHRHIIIPGYVAVISAPLADASGWQPVTGPKEASGIPSFLKGRGPQWS
ncbi:MAG: acetyl-CoA decarbonylase/synthase complex subunit gamma [Candidatus Xenobiia bacterium LiM19]